MRVFSILRSRRTTALMAFTALALFTAIMSPYFSATAQDTAADAPQVPLVYRTPYDFTGDGRTDFVNVNIPAAGSPLTWKILRNPASAAPGAAFIRIFDFGVSGDSLTPGDYYGDGKSEVSVWRTGFFYHAPFPEGTGAVGPLTVVNWGNSSGENLGRVGDYDGDGKDDEVTVRLAASLVTWVYQGSAGTDRQVQFGRTSPSQTSTLVFQGADYNGDGRDDFIYGTASTGTGQNRWFIGDSITGAVIEQFSFGNFITDYFLSPEDYTGDGRADIVVYRGGGQPDPGDGGFWFIRDSANGQITATRFGIPDPNFLAEDVPVRGNFDGDNRADICVYRRSNATYYWISSVTGTVFSQQWGAVSATELPIGAFFNF